MRINYHTLSSKISNNHSFKESFKEHNLSSKISDKFTLKEYFYGISRATQLINSNFIKIKNTISKIIVKLSLKLRQNNVAFSCDKILTKIYALLHAKDDNKIIFNNKNKVLIRTNIKEKDESKIKIINDKFLCFLIASIKGKEDARINIENEVVNTLIREKLKPDTSNIKIEHDKLSTLINVHNQSKENSNITFVNNKVNASAGYLTKLKTMTGTLNAYYNQTISDTGRKKVY